MGRLNAAVMMSELDLFWQSLFTWASWGIALLMRLIAWRMGTRQKTMFYIIAILAVGLGAYIEPLYDVAFDLWFHDVHNGEPGAMWSHFTAFEVIQPNWTHSGYVILYATACLYAGRMMYEGRVSNSLLCVIWLAEIGASCLFEVIGTGLGVYTYYGPYVLRIWNYPLVIGILEGTQVMVFTVLAVRVWRASSGNLELVGLFLLFPVTMLGVNTGIGGPIVIALHLPQAESSPGIIWVATVLTICLCMITVYGVSKFLPRSTVAEKLELGHTDQKISA